MRWTFLVTLLAAVVNVQANSGIFTDEGQVKTVATRADTVVQPRSAPMGRTNADRIRRGEPLLPPKRRGRIAARAQQSCVAQVSHLGKISVTRADTNVLLGYIRNTYDGQNSFTYGALADAATFQLPTLVQGGPVDITVVNGPDSANPLLGAVGGSGGYNFNSGQVGYAYFTGTTHVDANSPPSSSAGHSIKALGYNAPAESQIWSISCTGQLSAQWTNVDRSQPPTSFFYDTNVDFLGPVGDIAAFRQSFPNEDVFLVNLRFVPNP